MSTTLLQMEEECSQHCEKLEEQPASRLPIFARGEAVAGSFHCVALWAHTHIDTSLKAINSSNRAAPKPPRPARPTSPAWPTPALLLLLGNTTKTIKCGNSSAPTAAAAHTHPHTLWREEGAQVTGQSCCFFSPAPLLLDWPKTASTLYAPFSVRLATRAVRGGAEPQQPPSACSPVWIVGGRRRQWEWVARPCWRCSSLWTRKRNVSHKMLSPRFTTRLLRITRHPPASPPTIPACYVSLQ